MKKLLILFCALTSLGLFTCSIIMRASGWSEGLVAAAILFILIGLRFAVPDPIISIKK